MTINQMIVSNLVEVLGFNFKSASRDYGAMHYPEGIDVLMVDYLKFQTFRYEPQTFTNDGEGAGTFSGDFLGNQKELHLPIQSAADGNRVSWGNEINPIQAFAYQVL